MPDIGFDHLPEDLKKRLIHLKKALNAPTWTAFFYEVAELLEQQQIKTQDENKGCKECWYFGRWRTGDRLCNKTGELLDYTTYTKGCNERTEEFLPFFDSVSTLSNLAERLGVSVDELRKYLIQEKENHS